MEYRFLGKSGLKVSELSFGSWITIGDQSDFEGAYNLMKEAFDAGINFFDNAEVYSAGKAETLVGKVIKKAGWKRRDLVISTKLFWGGDGPNDRGLSRKRIVEGTNAALQRLQLEYVDLLFCHRPDLYTPVEETVRAMNHIINQGKALYWGTSEWSAIQLREALHIARENSLIPPLMEQPEYNLFCRNRVEVEYKQLYEEMGLGTTTWSPLAGGILTNKYSEGIPDGSRFSLEKYSWLREKRLDTPEGRDKVAKSVKLKKIASQMGVTLPRMAIAWCLKNPNVSSVILGASKPEQLRENLKAPEVLPLLTEDIIKQIEEVVDNKPSGEKDWRL